jgi:hypothetical protein
MIRFFGIVNGVAYLVMFVAQALLHLDEELAAITAWPEQGEQIPSLAPAA